MLAYPTSSLLWRPRSQAFAALPLIAGILLLGACSKPVEQAEDVRPVRAVKLAAEANATTAELPGEVRARIESRLGFRVPGKIVSREVEVGSTVRRGQVLMRLDPQDLRLAQQQANAALKAAESNRELARAELQRYRDLREKNFVSQAVLDSKQTAARAAEASYDQALAAYRNQSNQAGYATLVADVDGVVTAVDAEAGQVVTAGTPVVRVAQAGEKEVVIGIPEDRLAELRKADKLSVHAWALPGKTFTGRIREVSPVADPATRTYTARIAIPEASPELQLGMSAYVQFSDQDERKALHLPLTALRQAGADSAVWVVENGSVRSVPVKVVGHDGNEVLVEGGVQAGQMIVTAGVNQLKPGQKVKLLENQQVTASATGSAQ